MVAVRWYLRYELSYRDVAELLAERGIEVDHVTTFQWFTPLLIDAARRCRHVPGGVTTGNASENSRRVEKWKSTPK